MGEYRCPLSKKLSPNRHDAFHTDAFSNVCPVLREKITDMAMDENYDGLQKMIGLYLKYFNRTMGETERTATLIYECFIPSSLPIGYDPDGCSECSDF